MALRSKRETEKRRREERTIQLTSRQKQLLKAKMPNAVIVDDSIVVTREVYEAIDKGDATLMGFSQRVVNELQTKFDSVLTDKEILEYSGLKQRISRPLSESRGTRITPKRPRLKR